MDDETNGLADTIHPELYFRLLSTSSTTNRRTGRLTETSEQAVVLPVVPFPSCIAESVESTKNSPAALEQGVARASSVMHRVMEERAEQKRWQREMNRREREIRTQRAKGRMGREARKVVEANKWPQQHGAVTGPGCASLHGMIVRNTICGNCGRQKYSSRSSGTNIILGLTETRLPASEQCVEQACPLNERVLSIREEREPQYGREIERKEREIREQRARKKRKREAREQEEGSGWPQQQEAITGPWCMCANKGQQAAQASEQDIGALSEPQQESCTH